LSASLAGSVTLAGIPEPFAKSCSPDWTPSIGLQAQIGARSARGWDFRARYTGVRDAGLNECATEAPPEALEGEPVRFRRRTYEGKLWGKGIRTIDLQAGFVPPTYPFVRIAGGVGVEVDRGVPFLLGSAGLRSRGSWAHFIVGADLFLFRTPCIIVETEGDPWFGSRRKVGEGRVWRWSWLFHLGTELPVGLP